MNVISVRLPLGNVIISGSVLSVVPLSIISLLPFNISISLTILSLPSTYSISRLLLLDGFAIISSGGNSLIASAILPLLFLPLIILYGLSVPFPLFTYITISPRALYNTAISYSKSPPLNIPICMLSC